MEGRILRLAIGAVTAGAAVLGVGCTAGSRSGSVKQPSPAASQVLSIPFTVTARYTTKMLGLSHPDALAIGPDGNLYVTDLSQRVTVISPTGKVLRRWGKPGSAPGEFNFIAFDPTTPDDIHGKIAVGPHGMVYVSDSGNSRVQVFTPQGRFVRLFGSFGSGKGQFLHASDLVVDQAGNVYVADEQALTVTKFSPAGQVSWHIGSPSGNPDLIGHHHLAAIDPHGRLVMVNDDLQKSSTSIPVATKWTPFHPTTRPTSRSEGRARSPLMLQATLT